MSSWCFFSPIIRWFQFRYLKRMCLRSLYYIEFPHDPSLIALCFSGHPVFPPLLPFSLPPCLIVLLQGSSTPPSIKIELPDISKTTSLPSSPYAIPNLCGYRDCSFFIEGLTGTFTYKWIHSIFSVWVCDTSVRMILSAKFIYLPNSLSF